MRPKSKTFSAPGTASSLVSSRVPDAASLHTSSLWCCSSACTAACERLVLPVPYSAAEKQACRLCCAFFNPLAVPASSASRVSAPRLRHCACTCQAAGKPAAACCTRSADTPNKRRTQVVCSFSSPVKPAHSSQPEKPGCFYFLRNPASSASSAAASCCAALSSGVVSAGTLPCASRRASSRAVCAARARTRARSGRDTNSFFT